MSDKSIRNILSPFIRRARREAPPPPAKERTEGAIPNIITDALAALTEAGWDLDLGPMVPDVGQRMSEIDAKIDAERHARLVDAGRALVEAHKNKIGFAPVTDPAELDMQNKVRALEGLLK